MSEIYTPLEMANTFIQRHAGSFGIQHMKLQKLAYYAYGWWLAFKSEPVLNERPEVWKHGPVFESMYSAFKGFGAEPIKSPLPKRPGSPPPVIREDEIINLVDWTWGKYGGFSAIQLSEMTHAKDSPWYKIAKANNFVVPRHFTLDDASMKDYFLQLSEKDSIN